MSTQAIAIVIESLSGRADKLLLKLASRSEARLLERAEMLSDELEMFRNDLVRRGEASTCATGGPCTCDGDRALLDCALRNAQRRLTSLASRVSPGTRAELNAVRMIRATFERAVSDFSTASDCDEIAEAVVNAVDDVQDYLLSHDLVERSALAFTVGGAPGARRRAAVSRGAVKAWVQAQRVADGEPEFAISGSRLVGNGLKLA